MALLASEEALLLSLLPPQPEAATPATPITSTSGSSRATRALLQLRSLPDTFTPICCRADGAIFAPMAATG
jgi:hypothetical protein